MATKAEIEKLELDNALLRQANDVPIYNSDMEVVT